MIRLALALTAPLLLVSLVPSAAAQETDCGPEDLTAAEYVLTHDDDSVTNHTDLGGNVSMGDLVHATYEVGADCEGVELSIITYTREGNQHSSFDIVSTTMTEGTVSVGPALVPSCSFTVNVFTGSGPTTRRVDTDEGGEGDCPDHANWACPFTEARANSDGSISLTWRPVHSATTYEVRRAAGEGEHEVVATVDGDVTAYNDTDTEVGTTYHYLVVAYHNDHPTTRDCVGVTVTAIPEFPGLLVASAAGVAAMGAYVLLRRRG
jgi:hypothetical protein